MLSVTNVLCFCGKEKQTFPEDLVSVELDTVTHEQSQDMTEIQMHQSAQ